MITQTRTKLAGLLLVSAFLAACSSAPKQDDSAAAGAGVGVGDSSVTTQAARDDVDAYGNPLQRVFHFDFDRATLRPEVRSALDAHAARLRNNSISIRLEGHADERGTREYNMALGERRAKAVANYLAIQGIDSARIRVISYGEEKPVAFGSDEASWQQNRRVELVDVR